MIKLFIYTIESIPRIDMRFIYIMTLYYGNNT